MATVLVVEDNPQLGKMLTTALGAAGHDAQWVARGADALAHVARNVPSVVLIDLHLEDMTGTDLALRLRSETPDARLVAVSGDMPVSATAVNFDSFVLKPVSLVTLLALVGE